MTADNFYGVASTATYALDSGTAAYAVTTPITPWLEYNSDQYSVDVSTLMKYITQPTYNTPLNLVTKRYVDEVANTFGSRFYLTDSTSAVSDYLLTSFSSTGAESSVTKTNLGVCNHYI